MPLYAIADSFAEGMYNFFYDKLFISPKRHFRSLHRVYGMDSVHRLHQLPLTVVTFLLPRDARDDCLRFECCFEL